MSMQDDAMMQPDERRLHHLVNRPATPLPYVHPVPARDQLVTGCGLWVGCFIEETAVAAARVVIGDGGNGVATTELAPFPLIASQGLAVPPFERGVAFWQGLSVQTTAGATRGTVFAVLLGRDELDYLLRTRSGRTSR